MVELVSPADFKGLPEITNPVSFTQNGETPDGLYSKTIFKTSLKDQTNNYAYINLGTKIIQPLIFFNLNKVNPLFSKIVDPNYDIKAELIDGVLIESENGKRGVGWLYSIWDRIDFSRYEMPSKNLGDLSGDFADLNKDDVFTDKVIVIPPIYRPAMEENGITKEDEISGFYKSLIGLSKVQKGSHQYTDMLLEKSNKTNLIQKKANELYLYVIEMVAKANDKGLQEGKLIGKRMNNVARCVANANPRIPLDGVGTPWHILLGLFDAFVIAEIMHSPNKERYYKSLGISKQTNLEEFGQLFDYITRNVEIFIATKGGKEKKEILLEILVNVFNNHRDLRILLKRDPAWDKNSFHTLKPVIITDEGYTCVTNSMIYKPIGGDSFNTKICGLELEQTHNLLLKKEIQEEKKSFEISLPDENMNDQCKYRVQTMKSLKYYLSENQNQGLKNKSPNPVGRGQTKSLIHFDPPGYYDNSHKRRINV